MFFVDVETGACLRSEVAVTEDAVGWDVVLAPEAGYKGVHGQTLCGGSCVGVVALCVLASDVANADREVVHALLFAVGAYCFDGAPRFDFAVECNDVVVAYAYESAGFVPSVDIGGSEVLPGFSVGAVDDYCVDFAHGRLFLSEEFVVVVDAEEGAAECQDLAECDENRGVDLSLRRYDESGDYQCASGDDEEYRGSELQGEFRFCGCSGLSFHNFDFRDLKGCRGCLKAADVSCVWLQEPRQSRILAWINSSNSHRTNSCVIHSPYILMSRHPRSLLY